MTSEDEYMMIRELAAIETAETALWRVISKDNPIINHEEFRAVMGSLEKWRLKLYDTITIGRS